MQTLEKDRARLNSLLIPPGNENDTTNEIIALAHRYLNKAELLDMQKAEAEMILKDSQENCGSWMARAHTLEYEMQKFNKMRDLLLDAVQEIRLHNGCGDNENVCGECDCLCTKILVELGIRKYPLDAERVVREVYPSLGPRITMDEVREALNGIAPQMKAQLEAATNQPSALPPLFKTIVDPAIAANEALVFSSTGVPKLLLRVTNIGEGEKPDAKV